MTTTTITITNPPPTHDDSLTALWHKVRADLADACATIERAEDEIEQAICRYRDQADVLYHAFPLLKPGPGMHVEFVDRGHVRELLERAAAGQDTRPATAAELRLIASEASLRAPLTNAAAGLYFRKWAQAFPNAAQPGGELLAACAPRGAQRLGDRRLDRQPHDRRDRPGVAHYRLEGTLNP